MAKCGACCKYLTITDAAKCNKCAAYYHRACVALPTTGSAPGQWYCPECKKNLPRDNRPETPIKGSMIVEHSKESSVGKVMADEKINTNDLDLSKELRLFRDELRMVREEFKNFRHEMSDIKSSLVQYTQRLDSLDSRIDELEKRVSEGSSSNFKKLESMVEQLTREVNDRDQQLLSNDIEISNLMENSSENTIHIVTVIATKLGVNLSECDVVSAMRVGGRHVRSDTAEGPTEMRPRPLVVRLTRTAIKDELLRNARVRRGVTAADIGH